MADKNNVADNSDTIMLTNERAAALVNKYGSPLYVYDEKILRKRCREMKSLIDSPRYMPLYSAKANTNIEILKIIREEGLNVDAMSEGEILLEEKAGFTSDEILMVTNNISDDEIRFAGERGILMSCDSLSQLDRFGRIFPGRRVMVRVNPGMGAGHSDKVITAGSCKFGVEYSKADLIKQVASKYNLKIVGLNQHVGSLFINYNTFVEACSMLLDLAKQFEGLEIIDFGGGFGVPYYGDKRLDMEGLGAELKKLIYDFINDYGNKDVKFLTEAGRYISAECGILLGTVYSQKKVYGIKYIGTDLGFNVLIRPILYDSYHDIQVFNNSEDYETVNIVGNICESGDILAHNRYLPIMLHGDIIGVKNAGAYGYSMASNYNSRLRPAEVLIREDGSDVLIRKRDDYSVILNQL